MKILSTNSIGETKIKALIVGFSGAGKTTQARFLKEFKPLVISAESGLLSLQGAGIDYIDISKDDEGKLIPKELRVRRLMEVYQYVLKPETQAKYNLLYLDSLTEISQVLFDALRKEYPERKDNLVLYGELGQKMRDIIKAFRDAPHYHTVMTCLCTVDKDESTGKRFMAFDLIGGIKEKLAQYFDLVLYLRVNDEKKRELVCQQTDTITAKDRSGKLELLEPGDLGLVFKKAMGITPVTIGGNK